MDCREFRSKHVAFVDDLLSAYDMNAMQEHRSICLRCSRHDTAIRRSLLLVRNLPPIEPSSDFMARLNQRLEELGPSARVDVVAPRPQFYSASALAALAAGVIAVAYMAVETTRYFNPDVEMRTAAVDTATPFEPVPASIGNAAFVASVPTGMPVWPAMFTLGQAQLHFANMEFHETSSAR